MLQSWSPFEDLNLQQPLPGFGSPGTHGCGGFCVPRSNWDQGQKLAGQVMAEGDASKLVSRLMLILGHLAQAARSLTNHRRATAVCSSHASHTGPWRTWLIKPICCLF